MSEISKQALKVDNNQSFPNNNAGAITPAILRAFNENMIDSMVDEISYNADSASWNSQIQAISASAGTAATGSLLTTASFSGNTMTFTKGDGSTFGVVIPDVSGSGGDTTALNAFTASIAGTNAFTQSAQISINALNSATSSYAISSSVAAVDLAQQNQINAINAWTSSVVPTNITALNAFTASIAGTNAFTASIKNTNAFTASIAGTNAFTQSAQNSLNSLNAATSSYITSAMTASMSVASASVAATASLAREVIVSAINANQSTLPIGTVVRITGANGDNPQFNSASWESDSTSANALGILAHPAVSGQYADITVVGKVVGINTNGMTAGDVLYLGPNGTFTNVQPQAPLHIVTLGEVLRVQSNNGSMFVNISNGWELNELHNVRITSAQQGDLLVYEATSSLWKNQSSSSFAKTNQANTFNADQIVSGSMTVTGNLQVFGSASFTTVTSSIYIGGNTIKLNTFTPSVRFGGMEVVDSGSTGLTGSLLWDSQNDKWIYTNPSGGAYNSGMLISGPKNVGAPGNELGLVTNYIQKAVGDDHISSSQMMDDGTTVTIPYTASIGNIVGLGNPTAFSSSVDSRIDALVAATTDITALNAFSASTNLFTASIAGTNAFTQSINSRVSGLEAATASYANSASVAAVDLGQQNQINSLIAWTSSVVPTDITALNNFTASIAGTNAFTASATQRLNSLESTSASVNTSLASLNGFTASVAGTNLFTQSAQLEINALEAFSASALTTASFSGNTLTFTKGNGTTFGVILPDVSGSTINTGSFATTGSNAFVGNQTISGSLTLSSSLAVELNVIGNQIISGTLGISGSAITFVSGTLSGSTITNIGDTFTDVSPVNRIITLTSASYAALASGSTTDPNTLYIVSGSTSGSIAGAALIGNNTFSGSNVYTGSVQGNVVALSITSNTASMDFNAGNFFTLTLVSGSIPTRLEPTNIKAGQTISLVVTQASTLSGSITFPTTFKFPSGSSYVPSAVTSSKDIVTFITVDTSTIYASSVKNLI